MANIFLLNASAGSGKTFNIVQDFLKRCLIQPKAKTYRHILAITFTNKAASEMKSRVLRALAGFSSGKMEPSDHQMFNDLCAELQIEPDSLKKRSNELLKSILHDYSRFDIGTIDQFTARLVQTFAHDLDLPAQFEISLNFDELIAEAIHLLYEEIGSDEQLTKHLKAFVDQKIRDQKDWRIDRDLLKVGKLLGENHHRQSLDKILEIDEEELRSSYKKLIKEEKENASKAKVLAENFLSEMADKGLRSDHSRNAGSIFLRAENFKDINSGKDIGLSATLEKVISTKTGLLPKKKTPEHLALEPYEAEIIAAFERFYEEAHALYRRNLALNLIRKPFPVIMILKRLDALLESYQNENRLIHISNFNRLIAKEIQDQPMPFIFERLGERYQHYYLDEFQDTSIIQWENLFPLVADALSQEGGSCFLVGDGKQAIYRWRGGKVEQFISLSQGSIPEQFISDQGLSSPLGVDTKMLMNNWRSRAEIVAFVERFFMSQLHLLNESSHVELYKGVGQNAQGGEGGYVHLFKPEADDDIDLELLGWIEDLLQRNYVFRDLCCLVRNKKDGAHLAQLLSSHGYPVISGDSLILGSNPEANALANAIEFINHPKNDLARCRLLLYLQNRDSNPLWDENILMEAYQSPSKANQLLTEEFSFENGFFALKRFGLYECSEHIQSKLSLGIKSPAFIQLMLNTISRIEDKQQIGIPEFYEWWVEKEAKITLEASDDLNAIRIMTIHKSKGLEFPVVLIPFCNWTSGLNSKDQLWLELDKDNYHGIPMALVSPARKMEQMGEDISAQYASWVEEATLDNFNLLYVALTRAEKELYLGFPKPKQNLPNITKWFESYFEEENSRSFGEVLTKEVGTERESEQLESYVSLPWSDRVQISQQKYQSDAMKRGEIIHQLLASYTSMEGLTRSLEILKRKGHIKAIEAEQYESDVKSFLELPQFKPYFDDSLRLINERDLISSQGKVYRPDRLIIDGKKLSIVDFKTGEKDGKHNEQLDTYAVILKEAGFQVEEKCLLYLDLEEAVSW